VASEGRIPGGGLKVSRRHTTAGGYEQSLVSL